MITEENVTLYHCEFAFCKKTLRKKSAMEKHEEKCIYNPANKKACIDCVFCKIENIELETHFYKGDKKSVSTHCFKCTKLDKFMFPFSIERKNLHLKYPHTFENQEPMPNTCEHKQQGFIDNYNFHF